MVIGGIEAGVGAFGPAALCRENRFGQRMKRATVALRPSEAVRNAARRPGRGRKRQKGAGREKPFFCSRCVGIGGLIVSKPAYHRASF